MAAPQAGLRDQRRFFSCFMLLTLLQKYATSTTPGPVSDTRVLQEMSEIAAVGSFANFTFQPASTRFLHGYERLVMLLGCRHITGATLSFNLSLAAGILSPSSPPLNLTSLAEALGVARVLVQASWAPPSPFQSQATVNLQVSVGAEQNVSEWVGLLTNLRSWTADAGGPLSKALLHKQHLKANVSSVGPVVEIINAPCSDLLKVGPSSSPLPQQVSLASDDGFPVLQAEFDPCAPLDANVSLVVMIQKPTSVPPASLSRVYLEALAVDTRPYSVACMPEDLRRTGHTLTQVGSLMVLFGGLANRDHTEVVPESDLWVMNPTKAGAPSFKWESLDKKHNIFIRPRARYGHIAAGTSDGLLVIYGGHSSREYLHDLWVIRIGGHTEDPLKNEDTFPHFMWRECYISARGPAAALMMSSVMLRGGQWLIFGGQQDTGALSNEFWLLDLNAVKPSRVRWQLVPPFKAIAPSPRFGQSCLWWPQSPSAALRRVLQHEALTGSGSGGGLLVFGGVELDFDAALFKNDLWFLDIASHRWIELETNEADLGPLARHQPRPMPLAFHSALVVGSAMMVIGGIGAEVKPGSGLELSARSEIWRWMDEGSWSLQFAPAVGSNKIPSFAAGAAVYWPALGKLLLHGGQSTPAAIQAWVKGVLQVQQSRVREPYAPVMEYFPPIFSSSMKSDDIKSSVLLLEEEACSVDLSSSVPDICLPCSAGAVVKKAPDGHAPTAAPRAPWIPPNTWQCVPCPAGKVFKLGRCEPCPEGFFGTFMGMESWKMCHPCPAGKFSSSPGSSACSKCSPQGQLSAAGSTGPETLLGDPGQNSDPSQQLEPVAPRDLICPIFASKSEEVLKPQSVHEENEPHGSNAEQEHVWWQQFGFRLWFAALCIGLSILALLQARRPRMMSTVMRRFNMAPITAWPGPSEAGGVVFLAYVVTCSLAMVIGVAHQWLFNAQLTSMSVPAKEEFARIGLIEVDMNVAATLTGYIGPCVADDLDQEIGMEDDDEISFTTAFLLGQPKKETTIQPQVWDGYQESAASSSSSRDRRLRQARPRFLFEGQGGTLDDDEAAWTAEEFHLRGAHGRVRRASFHRAARSQGGFGAMTWQWLPASLSERLSKAQGEAEHSERRLKRTRNCHPLVSLTMSGINDPGNQKWTTCQRVDSRSCKVSLSCPKCSLSQERAQVHLRVQEGYAFTAAREIGWDVRTTWLQSDNLTTSVKAYSLVGTTVTSGQPDKCLRGAEPSVVRITVVPTSYTDNIANTKLQGFVTEFLDARIGSTAESWRFHTKKSQITSIVELDVSHSFYKLVLSRKSTAFDFLAKVLGFMSGMSLIARVLVAIWENLPEHCREKVATFWRNPVVHLLSLTCCFWIPDEYEKEDENDDGNLEMEDYQLVQVTISNLADTEENGEQSRTRQPLLGLSEEDSPTVDYQGASARLRLPLGMAGEDGQDGL